jgi:multiubiquitin
MSAKHEVVIFIDQQQFKLEDREYTPRELLTLAGDDPSETTLVLKHGTQLDKLIELDKPMTVKNGEHFVVFHNSPTSVS